MIKANLLTARISFQPASFVRNDINVTPFQRLPSKAFFPRSLCFPSNLASSVIPLLIERANSGFFVHPSKLFKAPCLMFQWRGRLTKDQQKLNILIKQQQTELIQQSDILNDGIKQN